MAYEDSVYFKRPWLKSYEPGVPATINYEEITMPDILDRTAAKYPEMAALIFQGYSITYRQMKDMVDRFATCLADFGVKQGDAVAILLPNTIPQVIAYYATLRIGAITVLNNPLYSDRELEHQFNDSGSKVLITLDLLGNRMVDLRPKTKVKQIVYTSIGDYLPFPKSLLFPLVAKKKKMAADVKAAPDVYKWKDCIAKYGPNPPRPKIGFEDVAMYQYTGGTTGVSKGCMLTHANLSKQIQQAEAWFQRFKKGAEICLGALPIFHVFGMTGAMNISVHMGWTDVLIPRPQPQQLLEAIRKFRPTFAALVPTMYIGMINHPDIKKTDMSCIKGAFSGSAPAARRGHPRVRADHGGRHRRGLRDDGDDAGRPREPLRWRRAQGGQRRRAHQRLRRRGSWISRRGSSTCPWASPASSSSGAPRS